MTRASDWQSISACQSFEVEANSAFEIKAKTLVDYCCT
ncbi:pyrimidine/purine nucleoside phosphorylase [Colwellia piezophila]|nr:pyrimidine/purine nucleoside phosphorylase [Colwellia piezophila]